MRLLAGASGAAFLSPLASWAFPQLAPGPSRRVIVIGVGLAGLTAAYELNRHGHRVVVLEARPRAGGRVFTLRNSFDDKLYAEAGGEWIHPEHHYVRHYAHEFGLELATDSNAAGVLGETGLEAYPLAEKTIPGYTELRRRLEERLEGINVFERPDRSALARLDRISYLDLLRELGASPAAIAHERIFVNTLMTVDHHEISALHMLYEQGLPQPDAPQSRVRGGNSHLVEAFARKLSARLRLGAPVESLDWDTRGVRVRYRQRGVGQSEEADHAIIAIPGTEVRRLRFDPELPAETRRAYAAVGYGRLMKVILQTRQRFWEKPERAYQWVYTHREAPHIYNSSWGQPGPRGLLTFYAAAWGADRWGRLASPERVTAARRLAGEIWPAAPGEIERGVSWFWNSQPWTRGSYAYFAPGQMTSVRPILSQPADRLHFAGEHTAVWQGYMNGAVESGLRAATEIEPAVGTLYRELTDRSRPGDRAGAVAAISA